MPFRSSLIHAAAPNAPASGNSRKLMTTWVIDRLMSLRLVPTIHDVWRHACGDLDPDCPEEGGPARWPASGRTAKLYGLVAGMPAQASDAAKAFAPLMRGARVRR